MTDLPYTDDDTRAEAARQYAEILRAPDRMEVQDEMQPAPIPSRNSDNPPVRWGQLSGDDFHDAANEVHELLASVPALSRWAVDLGADGLAPHPGALDAGDGPRMRVHFAFAPDMSDDDRADIVAQFAAFMIAGLT